MGWWSAAKAVRRWPGLGWSRPVMRDLSRIESCRDHGDWERNGAGVRVDGVSDVRSIVVV